MALTSLQGGGRGISFDDYFKQALNLDVSKLEAIIRGQDHSMPIVAAMAAYEVKKPMVTAATGQQAQQQLQQAQPTVRQEMEQEMDKSGMIPDMAMLQQQRMGPQPPVLPEEAGVGALPAPNMQGMSMAHGGIIAFDDGGEVPGYAGNEESLVEEETSSPIGRFLRSLPFMPQEYSEPAKQKLDAIASERRALGEKLFKLRGPFGSKQQTAQEQAEAERIQARMNELDKQLIDAKMSGSLETKAQERERKVRGTTDPNAGRRYKPYPTDVKKPTAVDPTAGQAVTDANASPGFIPPEKLPASKPPTTFASRQTPAGIAAVAPQPTKEAATSDMVTEALRASDRLGGGAQAEFKAGLANYGAEVKRGLDALAAERERGKPEGEASSKYEQSLLAEEAAAAGKEERNLQMALVNAGLAIAGGTSQYALENIGKGALVGTKQYMDGIDKLEAAAKKRQEALAMIEKERRAEARGDWKDKNEFAARRTEAELNAKKFGVEGLAKIYDVNTRTATDIFNNMEQNKTRMEAEREQSRSRKEVAEIGAGAQRYAVDKYSSVRGGNPLALATDDARQEWETWQKDKMNTLKTPEQKALAQRQIYERIFRSYGLPSPFTAGAAPQGGQRKPLAERTDLMQ